MNITNAIIPAAGLGTRFLPYTKSVAKELLPIMNTPAIEHIVRECLQSEINNFSIIANDNKHAIKDYLSQNQELNNQLQSTHKIKLLDSINTIIKQAAFTYVAQPQPLGLGHAVLMAEKTVTGSHCAILLPDEIIFSTTPAIKQLIDVAHVHNASVIAVQEVPWDKVSSYGIVSIKKQLESNLFQISHLVEKPAQDAAPSNLAIIGRYVLSRSIFTSLRQITPGAHNEIQLTDGITHMMNQNENVVAVKIDGMRHDIGNPIGWLQANISYALNQPESSAIIKNYIKKLDV